MTTGRHYDQLATLGPLLDLRVFEDRRLALAADGRIYMSLLWGNGVWGRWLGQKGRGEQAFNRKCKRLERELASP